MALERYCRDSFGYQRVHNLVNVRFDALFIGLSLTKQAELEKLKADIIEEVKNSGIRIPSDEPYIQKKCAFLLYHLIIAKPFYISGKIDADAKGAKTAYFNANVSVVIVNAVLATCGYQFFPSEDLLRDLTHRLLSRSAMEAVMRASARPIPITRQE
ncbi:MAG: hypothetical protein FWG17_01815 [Desulfovibrionaceae bacterium]|nr:hypothetical protein [Desulfovibrionaceae bacterium]